MNVKEYEKQRQDSLPKLFHLRVYSPSQFLMLIEKIYKPKARSYKMLNNSGLFQFIAHRIYFSLKYKSNSNP